VSIGSEVRSAGRAGRGSTMLYVHCSRLESHQQRKKHLVIDLFFNTRGSTMFYVHWVDFNRRLDSWIERSRLDLETTREKLREVRRRLRARDAPPWL
jgi:multisubunit Na+/H+ antiporter MnhE subunit